jgi:hypothetical protein
MYRTINVDNGGQKMLKAKAAVAFLAVIVSLTAGCAHTGERVSIEGSGNIVTQEENIRGFDEVHASHSFQLEIAQGDTYRVVIRADDNITDYLLVEREGDTLRIGLDPDHNYNVRNATLEAEVTMPELAGIKLSGSSDATITGFESERVFDADLSGSSSLHGDIEAGDANFDISGSSELILVGSAEELRIDASGSGDIDLSDFPATDANIDVSGSSTVIVHLSGSLDVDASGSSEVYYLGSPELSNIDTSGGSSVQAK